MDSETGSDQPASGVASAIPATLVLAPDHAVERPTPAAAGPGRGDDNGEPRPRAL